MDYKKSKMSFLVRQKRYQMSVLTNNSLNIGSRIRPFQACSALEDLMVGKQSKTCSHWKIDKRKKGIWNKL